MADQNLLIDEKRRFGKRLFELMAERGWTQSDLGRNAGIGRKLISDYVCGRSLPRPQAIVKLAQAFKVNPDELELLTSRGRRFAQEAALSPEFEITVTSVASGMAHVYVDRSFPVSIAIAIGKLVGDFYALDSSRSGGGTSVFPKPDTEPAIPGFADVLAWTSHPKDKNSSEG